MRTFNSVNVYVFELYDMTVLFVISFLIYILTKLHGCTTGRPNKSKRFEFEVISIEVLLTTRLL